MSRDSPTPFHSDGLSRPPCHSARTAKKPLGVTSPAAHRSAHCHRLHAECLRVCSECETDRQSDGLQPRLINDAVKPSEGKG